MKKIILLLFMLHVMFALTAQQRDTAEIHGLITNIDGDFIAGAEVSIKDLSNPVITNDAGYYSIGNIEIDEPIVILVIVAAEGFQVDTTQMSLVLGSNEHDVSLDSLLKIEGKVIINDVRELTDVASVELILYLNNDSIDMTNPASEDSTYQFNSVYPGNYKIVAKMDEYFVPDSLTFMVDTENVSDKNFALNYIPMSISIVSNLAIGCPGEDIILSLDITSVGVCGEPYTYLWTAGTEPIVGDTNTVTTSLQRDMLYSLKVTDECGNEVSAHKTIEIYDEPTIDLQPVDTAVCSSEATSFSIELSEENRVSYQWQYKKAITDWIDINNGGIYSGAKSVKLMVDTTTDDMNLSLYRCSYTRCVENYSDDALLIVHPLPNSDLIVKGNEKPIVIISPDSGMIYQWSMDGAEIDGATEQFYANTNGLDAGSYSVHIINTITQCEGNPKHDLITGVPKQINVYPNPANNLLTVKAMATESESDITIELIDLTGRVLVSTVIESKPPLAELSLDKINPGVYIVRVSNSDGAILMKSKIIKQ